MIRPVQLSDAQQIAEIYNHYVTETTITFEEVPISEDEYRERIEKILKASKPWLVKESGGRIVGYAYAGPWRTRVAYQFTVESAVYVSHEHQGQGAGSQLYAALLEELTKLGMHCVIGSIALPNPGSVGLHERFGFEKVAHHPEVGRKFDQWIDVGFWQLMLPK